MDRPEVDYVDDDDEDDDAAVANGGFATPVPEKKCPENPKPNAKYENFTYTDMFSEPATTTPNSAKQPPPPSSSSENTESDGAKTMSRLYSHGENSNFVMVKSYPIANWPFLRHWFLAFRDIEWHPGTPTNPIFVPMNNYERGEIEKIYELCDTCANNYLRAKIEQDKHFFLPFFNCDTMVGNRMETTLIFCIIIFFIFSIILPSIILFVMFLVSIVSLLSVNKFLSRKPEYIHCVHIKH